MYFVRCSDDSLYCGITNNLEKRIRSHNVSRSGAKYTRSRRPVSLVWSISVPTKSEALKIEYKLKKLRKTEKEKMISSNLVYETQIMNWDTSSGSMS